MPKVVGPCFSLSASKSLKKTVTYQKRPSGHAVYPHSKPGAREPFTRSPKQAAQRAIIAALVAQWRAFTTSIKAAWDAEAKAVGFLGTGYHYFISRGGIAGGKATVYMWSDPNVEWSDVEASWNGL